MDRVFLKLFDLATVALQVISIIRSNLIMIAMNGFLKLFFSYENVFLKLHFTVKTLNRNRIKPVS